MMIEAPLDASYTALLARFEWSLPNEGQETRAE
jgi:hypothetical protein